LKREPSWFNQRGGICFDYGFGGRGECSSRFSGSGEWLAGTYEKAAGFTMNAANMHNQTASRSAILGANRRPGCRSDRICQPSTHARVPTITRRPHATRAIERRHTTIPRRLCPCPLHRGPLNRPNRTILGSSMEHDRRDTLTIKQPPSSPTVCSRTHRRVARATTHYPEQNTRAASRKLIGNATALCGSSFA